MTNTARSDRAPSPPGFISPGQFVWRVFLIAVQLIAVYCFAHAGELFFYQGF
jgi:hypothetical protein